MSLERMRRVRYTAAIFDFDGTIAQTDPGVIGSARYALERMNWPDPGDGVLRGFLGPALYWSFEHLCGMDHDQASQALTYYRQDYSARGMFDIRIYDGLPELLRSLRSAGIYVAVASGKPDEFLKPILEKFGLLALVDAAAGPLEESTTTDKSAEILRVLPFGAARERCCMIGDRRYDIEAGRGLGLKTAGVTWGYGALEEFALADFTADTPGALQAYLTGEA